MEEDWRDYLKRLYYDIDEPGSLGGADKLYRLVKRKGERLIGLRRIKRWLSEQENYATMRHAQRKYLRSLVRASTIDECWHSDLKSQIEEADKNDGFKYVLVTIDVFSTSYVEVSTVILKLFISSSPLFHSISSSVSISA